MIRDVEYTLWFYVRILITANGVPLEVSAIPQ